MVHWRATLCAWLLCIGGTAWAQTEAAAAPRARVKPPAIAAKPLADALRDTGEPLVIGGELADPKQYPSSFRGQAGGRFCTWFLAGPESLIGAAHCVAGVEPADPLADVALTIDGSDVIATCTIPAEYWADRSQDWAACRLSRPAAVPGDGETGVAGFEVLGIDMPLRKGMTLEVSGFGCVVPGGQVVEGYRIGKVQVVEVPPKVLLPLSVVDTPNVIELAQHPSLLCEGDSGGPAFLYRADDDRIRRVVVGVNSRTLIAAGTSYLASVSTDAAKRFILGWAAANNVLLCGVHEAAPHCRPF